MLRPQFIAEIAKSHGGDMANAEQLILSAKNVGYDEVKFQYYDISKIARQHPNYGRYKDSCLTLKQLLELRSVARSLDIKFSLSVFNKHLLKEVANYFSKVKIPSTFYNDKEFIAEAQKWFSEIHISSGFEKTIADRSGCIQYACHSEYPTRYNSLKELKALAKKDTPFGYSYHGQFGNDIIVATALGADYIEMHFNETCLDHNVSAKSAKEIIKQVNEFVLRTNRPNEKQLEDNYKFYSKEFKK